MECSLLGSAVLLSEWGETEAHNDVIAMEEIEALLVEVRGLRYNV